jgi:hypothetical protein
MGDFVDSLGLEKIARSQELHDLHEEKQIRLIQLPTAEIWQPSQHYSQEVVEVLKKALYSQLQENELYQAMLEQEGWNTEDFMGALSIAEVGKNTHMMDLSIFKQKIESKGQLVDSPLPDLLFLHPSQEAFNYWLSSATGSGEQRNPSKVHRTQIGTYLMAACYLDGFEHICQTSLNGEKRFDKLILFAPDPDEENIQRMLEHSQFSLIAKQAEILGDETFYALDFSGIPETWGRLDMELIEAVCSEADQKGETLSLGASPMGMYGALRALKTKNGEDFSYRNIPALTVFDGGGGLESGRKGSQQMPNPVSITDFVNLIQGVFPKTSIEDIASLYATSEVCFVGVADYRRNHDGEVIKTFHNPGYADTAVLDVNSFELKDHGEGLLAIVTALNVDNAGSNVVWTTDYVRMTDKHPVTGVTGKFWNYLGRASDIVPGFEEWKSGCGMNYLQLAEQEGILD